MRSNWVLVGRAAELRLFQEALAGDRMPGVVLAGAAGVGKTRLATELVGYAGSRGWVTAWTAGSRSMASIPFGSFAHLLPGTAVATVSSLDVVRRARAEVRRRSPDRPLVLGVDDAHLLDDSSAGLVHHLAATGATVVVVTLRSGAPVPDAVRALWKDGIAERVELGPLSRTETGELLAGVLGGPVDAATVHRLWAGSGGNALFLRELVLLGMTNGRLLSEHGVWSWRGELAGGTRLSELIDDRLAGLTGEQRAGMETLAVGEPLPTALFETLAGDSVLQGLESRGLLAVTMDGRRSSVAATHPLYTEALRAGIRPLRRRVICRDLAAALAATGARRREDVLRLVLWQLDGGVAADPELLVEGARRAIWLFDHPLAERLARAAGRGVRAEVLLAESLLRQGRVAECREVLDGVDLDNADDNVLHRWAYTASINAFWGLGDFAAAESVLQTAQARLPAGPDRDNLVGQRAVMLFYAGRPAEAVAAAEPVVMGSWTDAEAWGRAGAAYAMGLAAQGRITRALEACQAIRAEAVPALGDQPLLIGQFHGTIGFVNWQAGRFVDMEAACTQVYEQVVAARAHDFRGFVACQLGRALLGRGLLTQARARLREAVAVLHEVDVMGVLPLTLAWLARCAAQLGDLDEARVALAECDAMRLPALAVFDVDVELARAWLAAAGGEVSTARRLALAAATAAEARQFRALQLEALYEAVRLGEPGLANRLAEVDRQVEHLLAPTYMAHATALEAGDGAALDTCSSRFDEMGCPLLAAEAAVQAAEAHAEAGRRASESTALHRARAWAEQCGGAVTPILVRARQAPSLALLTDREREIAELAVRGLSNRDIAQRLVLSQRTVGNHLNNVYGKLGIAGRAGLADLFRS